MARISLSVLLALTSACIFIEDDDNPTDGSSPTGDPTATTPTPTTPGIEDGVLPERLDDGPVTLTDRVKDPSLPDYVAEDGVVVQVELTVDPGVVIAFGNDTTMTVDGRAGGSLNAVGTEKGPIVFTNDRQEPGAWGGVYIDNVKSSLNRLDYVTIEYGGGQEFGAGLGAANLGVGGFVGEARISVSNSSFRNSASHGIELEFGSELVDFEDNVFASNAGFDLRIPADVLGAVGATNAVSPQGIEVVGFDVVTDAVWVNLGVPVAFDDEVAVHANLVIEPGVELQFGDNVGLVVDGRATGTLVAEGTAKDPIVFTARPGVNWRGLWIDNTESSLNVIRHAVFEFGGFSSFEAGTPAQLTIGGFVGTSTITVEDCTFTDTAPGAVSIALQSDAIVNVDIETVNTLDQGLQTF